MKTYMIGQELVLNLCQSLGGVFLSYNLPTTLMFMSICFEIFKINSAYGNELHCGVLIIQLV